MELFCVENCQNQKILVKNWESIVKVMYDSVKIEKLFSMIFENIKESEDISYYIDQIIRLLNWNSIIKNYFNCNQLLSVLKSFLKNKKCQNIVNNQHLILAKIIKITNLMKFQNNDNQVDFINGRVKKMEMINQSMEFTSYENYFKENYTSIKNYQ